MPPERITARELFAPPGYAHAVEARGVIHTAGAVPLDADGNLVGEGDVRVQAERVLANLEVQLRAAGATPADVVKTVVYVATENHGDLPAVWEVVQESPFAGAASTLLGVSLLGYAGQLVEIDATVERGG